MKDLAPTTLVQRKSKKTSDGSWPTMGTPSSLNADDRWTDDYVFLRSWPELGLYYQILLATSGHGRESLAQNFD
jgi:hypothetical protein